MCSLSIWKCLCFFSGLGDRVLVAIKGEKKYGVLVGMKKASKFSKVPKFDSNNVVLMDEKGTPLGTRIQVPIPMILRTIFKKKTFAKSIDYTKILSIATKYV